MAEKTELTDLGPLITIGYVERAYSPKMCGWTPIGLILFTYCNFCGIRECQARTLLLS